MQKKFDEVMGRDLFAYHGHTEVERTRKRGDQVVSRNWILFDSVEEAMDYYHSQQAQTADATVSMPAWMIHAATAT